MKKIHLLLLLSLAAAPELPAQCKIVLDTLDEFDTSRIIAAKPLNIGFLVPTGNVEEGLEGKQQVEQAKAIFSYATENDINSFFLTLGVVERKFYLTETDFNVHLLFADGNITSLLNVPDQPEFDRGILMWKYVHTCVVPMEVFQMLKNTPLEKIRIAYPGFKQTIALEPKQQKALEQAVLCVEERVLSRMNLKP